MKNEVIEQDGGAIVEQQDSSPFNRMMPVANSTINAGAVTIESERAIAEARGQMQLAKMFPRNEQSSYAELMDACKLPALADVAFYSVPRAGGRVSGPTIRIAEEIARIYGNFEFGHRELSRTEAGSGPRDYGRSEVEVYAWDKEKNNRSIRQITVIHTLDTKDGPRKLRDQKDVDDKIANVASKQVRGRILALVPKWMVEAAIQECRKTLSGDNDVPLSERVRRMTQRFAKLGVTTDHIERYLGGKLDEILADDIADLQGVYNSIREGTPASEFFGGTGDAGKEEKSASIAAIAESGKKQQDAPAERKPNRRLPATQKGKPEENKGKDAKEEQDTEPVASEEQDSVQQNSDDDNKDSDEGDVF